MAFSPPVLGCLVKKGLQKGGLRALQDPPGYALERHVCTQALLKPYLLHKPYLLRQEATTTVPSVEGVSDRNPTKG